MQEVSAALGIMKRKEKIWGYVEHRNGWVVGRVVRGPTPFISVKHHYYVIVRKSL